MTPILKMVFLVAPTDTLLFQHLLNANLYLWTLWDFPLIPKRSFSFVLLTCAEETQGSGQNNLHYRYNAILNTCLWFCGHKLCSYVVPSKYSSLLIHTVIMLDYKYCIFSLGYQWMIQNCHSWSWSPIIIQHLLILPLSQLNKE